MSELGSEWNHGSNASDRVGDGAKVLGALNNAWKLKLFGRAKMGLFECIVVLTIVQSVLIFKLVFGEGPLFSTQYSYVFMDVVTVLGIICSQESFA